MAYLLYPNTDRMKSYGDIVAMHSYRFHRSLEPRSRDSSSGFFPAPSQAIQLFPVSSNIRICSVELFDLLATQCFIDFFDLSEANMNLR